MNRVALSMAVLSGLATLGVVRGTHAQQAPNEKPSLPLDRAWRVGTRPIFVAGDGKGGDTVSFYRVRGAVTLPQGRIVVANAGGNELVYLNPDGSLLTRAGRKGEGPGEFVDVSGIGRAGDGSVWAMDLHRGTLSMFDDGGALIRTVPLRQLVSTSGMMPRGVLTDGRLVLTSNSVLLGAKAMDGDSTDVVVFDPGTGFHHAAARIPKPDFGDPVGSTIFGAPTVTVAGGDEIYWASGSRFEIFVLSPDGGLKARIQKPTAPRSLTSDVWLGYVDRRLTLVRGSPREREAMRRQLRLQLDQLVRPRFLPFLDKMLLDHEGNLWVHEYEIEGVLPGKWQVFNPQGRWLTTVELPERFRLHDVFSAGLLGVLRDDSDVERVVLLPLERP